MMTGVEFLFLASSLLFVTSVVSFQACPDYESVAIEREYEAAFANSVNKFLKDLKEGLTNLDMQLENTTSFDSNRFEVRMRKNDKFSVFLENMTVSGFSDLTVSNVAVRPRDPNADMLFSLELEIPYISITADYHLNGTWHDKSYNMTEHLNLSSKNAKASMRLGVLLDNDYQHWNLATVSIRQYYIYNHAKSFHTRGNVIDEIEDYAMKALNSRVTLSIDSLLSKHLEDIVQSFLNKLLRQVSWYAIMIGEFDPHGLQYDAFTQNPMWILLERK